MNWIAPAVFLLLAGPLASAAQPGPAIAKDVPERVAKWKKVEAHFSPEGFTPRELTLVHDLVAACQDLEKIYWRQSDPEDLDLYDSLRASAQPLERAAAHLLWINGSRYDLLDENRPFIGVEPMPPGAALYPKGLTRDEVEAYVKAHPDQKTAIYDAHTVVERTSSSPLALRAVPYHAAYKTLLESAAGHLRDAASHSDDPAFAAFLRARAEALLTDDYYPSDLLWVQLQNPKFDVIFAPYETYLDGLLGVKTSYGAAVLIRNEAESAKLAVFQKYVPDIQDALPLDPADRPSKKGHATPMEVMDTPYRAGDLRHGYQAVADNLPNDPRIHERVGSKKIFFKNYMDARVESVILPVAQRLMTPEQAKRATADGYLAFVMMHEISHGLGPAFARIEGKPVSIREAIGPVFSALEEAKADVTGMFALEWLVDHGELPKERLQEYYSSYLASVFRTVRFGTGEAHGRAEMMQFNVLAEGGAIHHEAAGRYAIDYAKIPAVLASLAKELLEIEATGDRSRAEKWFAKYGTMPGELKTALEAAKDLPVDLDPEQPFPEAAR